MKLSWVVGLGGLLFTVAVAPVISEIAISYAEDAGWLDNTKQNVDGVLWSVVLAAGDLGRQAWYTHSLAAILGVVTGFGGLLLYQKHTSKNGRPVPVEDTARLARALTNSIVHMQSTLSSYAREVRYNGTSQERFGRLLAEWHATSLDLTKNRFRTPNMGEQNDSEAVKTMRVYLDGLAPLVRSGHLDEARVKSEALSSDLS